MTRSRKIILTAGLLLLPVLAAGSKPQPLTRWQKAGKKAHVHAQNKKGKALNSYCTTACKKSGAHKRADIGACKEACFFG